MDSNELTVFIFQLEKLGINYSDFIDCVNIITDDKNRDIFVALNNHKKAIESSNNVSLRNTQNNFEKAFEKKVSRYFDRLDAIEDKIWPDLKIDKIKYDLLLSEEAEVEEELFNIGDKYSSETFTENKEYFDKIESKKRKKLDKIKGKIDKLKSKYEGHNYFDN